jgi:hypothetical protein
MLHLLTSRIGTSEDQDGIPRHTGINWDTRPHRPDRLLEAKGTAKTRNNLPIIRIGTPLTNSHLEEGIPMSEGRYPHRIKVFGNDREIRENLQIPGFFRVNPTISFRRLLEGLMRAVTREEQTPRGMVIVDPIGRQTMVVLHQYNLTFRQVSRARPSLRNKYTNLWSTKRDSCKNAVVLTRENLIETPDPCHKNEDRASDRTD